MFLTWLKHVHMGEYLTTYDRKNSIVQKQFCPDEILHRKNMITLIKLWCRVYYDRACAIFYLFIKLLIQH